MLGFSGVVEKGSFGSEGSRHGGSRSPRTGGADGGGDPRFGVCRCLSRRRSSGGACSVDHHAVRSSSSPMGRAGSGVQLRSQKWLLFFFSAHSRTKKTRDRSATARHFVEDSSGQ